MINRDDITRAHHRIKAYVRQTPLLELKSGNGLPVAVTAKLELTQHSGSFKPRGAFNALLSQDIPAAGVVAASGGNHGAAVAYAAGVLGHRARIFVPEISSAVKIDRIRAYGAEIVIGGAAYAEALAASDIWASDSGALALHAYDDPLTVAGQGTLARELAGQMDVIDTILVAVGGGGLIGGVAAWFGNGVRIVSVEPEGAPTLQRAMDAGTPVKVGVSGIAADSLGAARIGDIAFGLSEKYVNQNCLVSDADIGKAQTYLWDSARLIAEPGGAAALAAVLGGAYTPKPGEKVVVIICGGNAGLDGLRLSNNQGKDS